MNTIPEWENLDEQDKYSPDSEHNEYQVTYLSDETVFTALSFHPAGSGRSFKVDTVYGIIDGDKDSQRYMIPNSLKLHPKLKARLIKEEKARIRKEKSKLVAEKKRLIKEKKKLKAKEKLEKEKLDNKKKKLSELASRWTCKICSKKFKSKSNSHLKTAHNMEPKDYVKFLVSLSGTLEI